MLELFNYLKLLQQVDDEIDENHADCWKKKHSLHVLTVYIQGLEHYVYAC